LKKVLAEFISQILFKKAKIQKKISKQVGLVGGFVTREKKKGTAGVKK
jgi:hypothetical protein